MSDRTRSTVIVAVDGGAGSAGALRYAVEEAAKRASRLQVVHVAPTYVPGPYLPSVVAEIDAVSRDILERARAEVAALDAGLSVDTRMLRGSRVGALVRHTTHAALLVLGRETRHVMERLVTGTTTAAVAAHAEVPVVAVPSEWAPGTLSGPVVAGLKGAAHADELFTAAFREASGLRAPLRVVHAWMLPDVYIERIEARIRDEEWRRREVELVEELLVPWRRDFPEVEVSVDVVKDDPGHALVNASRDARLVVLLRRPPRPLLGSHLGGTGRAVLREAPCPVEVVPATRSGSRSEEQASERLEALGG